MSTPQEQTPREVLIDGIRAKIPGVEARVRRLSTANSRYIYLGIIAGALATFVAGLTAFKGAPLLDVPQQAKQEAWQITCAIAAMLTLVATLCTGLQKALTVPEKLGAAIACLGRLRALDLALTVRGADHVEIAREYENLISSNAELLA